MLSLVFQRIDLPIIFLLLGFFIIHALLYNFTQDDSFIIFRYAKNFANGYGLVFNIGEKVEGYTCFLWTILMGFIIYIGQDPVLFSKVFGLIFSFGSISITYLISKRISQSSFFLFPFISVLLLVSNGAFALWTISGMETSMFLFFMLTGIYFYILEWYDNRNVMLSAFSFALASLTRPEGLFIFGLTLVHRLWYSYHIKKFKMKKHFQWVCSFLIIVVPHVLLRILYYGYPFPNTFYAKSGMSWFYIQSGVDYTVKFLQQYGLFGIALILPCAVLYFRRDRLWYSYFVLIIIALTAYVISIGGDVLLENRFFIPIFPLMYIFIQEALYDVCQFRKKVRGALRKEMLWIVASILIVMSLLLYTALLPKKSLSKSRDIMSAIVRKFKNVAEYIEVSGQSNITIAATGVGALAYYSNATVIDMFGLTDEHIAHHPEFVKGLSSPNKEQRYNASYVLSKKPDFIYFVTDWMPSALAEKALYSCTDFRQGYYLSYPNHGGSIFKRKKGYRKPDEEISTYNSVEFIEQYYMGFQSENNPQKSIEHFQKSIELGPKDFAYPFEFIGRWYDAKTQYDEAMKFYQKALEIDEHCIYSRLMLGKGYLQKKDPMSALSVLQRLTEIEPKYYLGHVLLGRAYFLNSEFEEANREFEEAKKLKPTYADSYYYLGLLQVTVFRNTELGIKYWERFIQLDPKHYNAEWVSSKLKALKGK